MPYSVSQIRKFAVAVVGFVVTVLTTALAVGPDLIPNDALPYVHILIAVATSYGVFHVKNQPAPGQPRNPLVSETVPDAGASQVGLLVGVVLLAIALYVAFSGSVLFGVALAILALVVFSLL